jgi:carboxyl-terminal processing protease
MRRNPSLTVNNRTFSITDKDYADFMEFISDKDVPYQSQTRLALEMLQRTSKQERYDDDFAEDLKQIESKLKDQKMDNLQNYRAEIENLINADIVLRHNYQEGVVEYNLTKDSTVMKAVDLLRDGERYSKILQEQDTEKN